MSKKSSRESPPGEALKILSRFLDPKTIGIACCVNKTWWASLSSDDVWKPICLIRFPSLCIVHLTHPAPSYKHIYAMGHVASLRGRSMGPPPPPRVAMGDIFFTVDVLLADTNAPIFGVIKPGRDLAVASSDGLFHFEFDADPNAMSVVAVEKGRAERLIVRWCVATRRCEGVFKVMDCEGTGRSGLGDGRWFAVELPPVPCCVMSEKSEIVAQIGFKMSDQGSDGKMVAVEKVGINFLSTSSWGYVTVEDALRYLQWFLLP